MQARDRPTFASMGFIRGPLAEDPFQIGKSLLGDPAGEWSARRGEDRVICTIRARLVTVTIIRIAHRRDDASDDGTTASSP